MTDKIPIGTIGLGLMGCSIATCLLAAGHPVTSFVLHLHEADEAKTRVLGFLLQMREEGILKEDPETVITRFSITGDYGSFAHHQVIIESIIENIDQKRQVYHALEAVVSPAAIIGSNTSALPVTLLQAGLKYPGRMLGIHWAEPAHITRFMEVICGNESEIGCAEKIIQLARGWGKEPALLKKDIRGFITNRIMYAMLREAFHLVEQGYASYEDVDRSLRNDLGSWITLAGPFRFMDLTGIPAYYQVMKDLLPELNNSAQVPALMQTVFESGAKGVSNAQGFYKYTRESAQRWEKRFIDFSYDIRKLSQKYPEDVEEAAP